MKSLKIFALAITFIATASYAQDTTSEQRNTTDTTTTQTTKEIVAEPAVEPVQAN